jgi:sarcosine oxidase subunit alpha
MSSASFPYLAYREIDLAGVPCRLLRLGFVGELGCEIHCPASQGWHLWEALCREGAGMGLRPFGVEAQRILRLEKGHPIIGTDTDALSNPWEAGMESLVRLEKPLFHGRGPLMRLKEKGPRSRLVGFRLAPEVDGTFLPASLPSLEGCQVVEHSRPVGRVTSARHSPTLGHAIGLAWVPAALAREGERFLVRWNGADVPAVVAPVPFYDPQGRRLRES